MNWGDFKSLVRTKVRIESSSYARLDNVPPFGSPDDKELWRLFQVFCRISRQFWIPYLPLSLRQGDQDVDLMGLARCSRRIFRPASVWVAGLELDAYAYDALTTRFPPASTRGFVVGTLTSTLFVPGTPGYAVLTDGNQNFPANALTSIAGISGGIAGLSIPATSNTATGITVGYDTPALVGDSYRTDFARQASPLGWSESRQGVITFQSACDASVANVQNAVSGFADHVDPTSNADALQIDVDAIEAAAECVACWLGRPVASDQTAVARLGEYAKYSQDVIARSRAQGEREARFTPKITASQLSRAPWRRF